MQLLALRMFPGNLRSLGLSVLKVFGLANTDRDLNYGN